MDPTAVAFRAAGIAALPSLLSFGLSGYIWRKQRGEFERRKEWERELQDRQTQLLLIGAQPDLAPTGANIAIYNETVPQLLAQRADAIVGVHNQGGTIPSEVRAVLFPSAVNLPPDAPQMARTEELFGTYWEGTLEVPPDAGGRADLTLWLQPATPLRGDMSIVEGYTLFAPPQPDENRHFNFARLTIVCQDRHRRTLASVWDYESVTRNGDLTKDWHRVVGPVVVTRDLRTLKELAARERQPPLIG